MNPQPCWARIRIDGMAEDARRVRDGLRAAYLRRLSEAERDRCRDSLASLADAVLALGAILEEPGLDALAASRRQGVAA
jgi:hypothetical protein